MSLPAQRQPLPTFDVAEPSSLRGALELLASDPETVRPIAGGTAIMLLVKYGFYWPDTLVSLERLRPTLGRVQEDAVGGLRLGALVTLREIETSAEVRAELPTLAAAAAVVANVRVRNVATLGGHLAHADPHMDLPAVLMVLDARVRVESVDGFRWLTVAELYNGYYETTLLPGELLTDVHVPLSDAPLRSTYRKFTMLSEDDWPALGVAAAAQVGDRLEDVRVAISAVGDRVRRLPGVEGFLEGEVPSTALFASAGLAAADELSVDGDDLYMAELVQTEVRRALQEVVGTPAETLQTERESTP